MLGYYSERCYLYAMVSRMWGKHQGDKDNVMYWVSDAIYGVAAGISSREHMTYLAEHAETPIVRQGYSKAVKFLAIVQKQAWGDKVR